MTARQSSIANWLGGASLAVILLGAGGAGVWWAATLSTKVDEMQKTLAYLKDRIDGVSPATPTEIRSGRRP